MRLLYKPLALIAGLIARMLGRSTFRALWGQVDEEPPPEPLTGEGSMAKLVGARALQAGVMAAAAAVVERLAARLFHHLIGIWPKKLPDPDDD
ncbi:MAG: DUF4235 domain-containing protein [Solirubrobacteraceae bacterium]